MTWSRSSLCNSSVFIPSPLISPSSLYSALVRSFQQGVQKHVCPRLAIFPLCVFHFYMAASADARDEDHCRGAHLVYVAGVMSRAAHHVQVRVPQFLCRVQHPLHQLLIEGSMGDTPGFLYPYRGAPAPRYLGEVLLQQVPRLQSMVVIPGPNVNSEMHLVR